MNNWDADPAFGCGVTLVVLFVLLVLIAAFCLAFLWSKLVGAF